MIHDVLIAGGGPAGLTAALVLARAGRNVLVLDAGKGRNAPAAHAHNVFTRDGASPLELRRIGREQAEGYGARFLDAEAVHASADAKGVQVRLADGTELKAHRLLLATGVVDELPDLPGLAEAWGETAVHCPYCHGYELRGRPTAVLARGERGVHLATLLLGWTDQVTLLSDGPAELSTEQQAVLTEREIAVREERLSAFDVAGRQVQGVLFASGERMEVGAVYVSPPQHLRGSLPDALGLARTDTGLVKVDETHRTSVPNVWACGDLTTPMQAVQGAGASGLLAAAMINFDLIAAGTRYKPDNLLSTIS